MAERMAALMCVEGDADADEGHDANENGDVRGRVMEIVDRETEKARERGIEEPSWLELEELGVDDEMLRCLDLSSKFPVTQSCH